MYVPHLRRHLAAKVRPFENLPLTFHFDQSRTVLSSCAVEKPASFLESAKVPVGRAHVYVYIMASRSRTLYVGFTSDLFARVMQHRSGAHEGFTAQYRCHRLVWYERYGVPIQAIAREKQIKRWSRSKKIALIERENPGWADLAHD